MSFVLTAVYFVCLPSLCSSAIHRSGFLDYYFRSVLLYVKQKLHRLRQNPLTAIAYLRNLQSSQETNLLAGVKVPDQNDVRIPATRLIFLFHLGCKNFGENR